MANLFARMMGLCRGLPGFAASNGGAKLLRLCVAAVAFSGLFALIDSESANAAAAGGRKLTQPSFVRDKTERSRQAAATAFGADQRPYAAASR